MKKFYLIAIATVAFVFSYGLSGQTSLEISYAKVVDGHNTEAFDIFSVSLGYSL